MKTKPKKYPDPEMPTNGEICHIVQILLASGRTFPDMATAANEALRIYLQIWKWERHDEESQEMEKKAKLIHRTSAGFWTK